MASSRLDSALTPYLNHLLTITIFATLKAELALISVQTRGSKLDF